MCDEIDVIRYTLGILVTPIDPFLEYLECNLTNLGHDHLQSKIISDFRKKTLSSHLHLIISFNDI